MADLQSTPIERTHNALPEFDHSANNASKAYGAQQDIYHAPPYYAEQHNPQAAAPEMGGEEHKGYGAEAEFPGNESRRYCGVRKGIVIGVLVAIVLLGAVVGGAVGGTLGKRNAANPPTDSSTGQNPQIAASHNPSTLPSSIRSVVPSATTTATLPTVEPMRTIVATHWNSTFFFFWQKQNGDLWMRGYYGKVLSWASTTKLPSLGLPAVNNTPISAAIWAAGDVFEVRLHYTSSVPPLIEMGFQCRADGSGCNTPTTNIVNDERSAIAPGAGTLMLVSGYYMLRQYHVNTNGLVAESVYNYTDGPKAKFRPALPISNSARAHKFSPITGRMVGDTIRIFWFDEQRRLQTASSIATTAVWTRFVGMYLPPVLTQHQVETITTTIPAQIPRALGIGNTQVLDVYFLDGVEMQHVRVSGGGTTTGPASLDASILSGPMGVTAWQDVFARLYYPVDDGQKIMEAAAYEDGHWELSAMEGASYN